MKNNQEKSNRLAADYFELLVAQGISDWFGTGDSYISQIDGLRSDLLKKGGGQKKVTAQNEHFEKSIKQTLAYIEKFQKVHGAINKVEWVGRYFKIIKSKADVIVSFKDKSKIGLSVKSVGSGSGTLDNAGKEMSKKYFGLDISLEMKKLEKKLRKIILEKGLGEGVAKVKWTKLRDLKHKYPELVKIGKEVGLPVQKMATETSVKGFNQLSEDKKIELVEKMLGVTKEIKMIFLLVSNKNVDIKDDLDLANLMKGKLSAVLIKDKSFSIQAGGKSLIRVQSAFTNGTGLSAFCQRAFLDWK